MVELNGNDEIVLDIPQTPPTMWIQNIVINVGKGKNKETIEVQFIAYDVEQENKLYFLEQLMYEYASEYGIL